MGRKKMLHTPRGRGPSSRRVRVQSGASPPALSRLGETYRALGVFRGAVEWRLQCVSVCCHPLDHRGSTTKTRPSTRTVRPTSTGKTLCRRRSHCSCCRRSTHRGDSFPLPPRLPLHPGQNKRYRVGRNEKNSSLQRSSLDVVKKRRND